MDPRWPKLLALATVIALAAAGESIALVDIIIDDSEVDFSLFQGTLQFATGNDSYGGSYHFIENWGGSTQHPNDARSARAFYFLPYGFSLPPGDHLYTVYAWMPDVEWEWHVVEAAGDGTEYFDQDIEWGGQYGTNKQWLMADPRDPFNPQFDPTLGGRWLKLGPGPQSDPTADGGSAFHLNPSRGNPYLYLGYQEFYTGLIAFDALRIVQIVPEPGTVVLLLLGCGGVGLVTWPRRRGTREERTIERRDGTAMQTRWGNSREMSEYMTLGLVSRSSWRYGGILIALILGGILTGCQQRSGEVSQAQTNLGWLGSMYGMYVGQNNGQTPKTVDDLRKFVEQKTSAEELARLQVADVSQLFVSPRDGKPFRMVSYATLPAPAGGQPPPVVLYESMGQGGQRGIAYLGGGTDTIDETELEKLLPAQSKAAP